MLSLILLTSTIWAAEIQPPKIPSRLTCVVVKTLYKQYSKHYTQVDMENYLRSKGISEERIVGARLCLAALPEH